MQAIGESVASRRNQRTQERGDTPSYRPLQTQKRASGSRNENKLAICCPLEGDFHELRKTLLPQMAIEMKAWR